MPEARDPYDRFIEKVMPEPNTGCWIWLASFDLKGYGQFMVGSRRDGTKKMIKAYRYSFEYHKGPRPPGLEIDHLCRNRWCVNPDHLEAVTHQENCRRGISPAAINARMAHCRKGHEFTAENTWRSPNGNNKRRCRECDRVRMAAFFKKRKDMANVASWD